MTDGEKKIIGGEVVKELLSCANRFLQGYGDHKNCEKTSDGEREREREKLNSLRNEGQPKGSLQMTATKRNSGCYDRRHDLGC